MDVGVLDFILKDDKGEGDICQSAHAMQICPESVLLRRRFPLTTPRLFRLLDPDDHAAQASSEGGRRMAVLGECATEIKYFRQKDLCMPHLEPNLCTKIIEKRTHKK